MTSRTTSHQVPVKRSFPAVLYGLLPVVITVAAYYGVWNNSFTNWDDDVYVTGNTIIHSLSWSNIIHIFGPHNFLFGNYQPITVLSYAVSYAAGGNTPSGYILADLLIHLLNVALVFIVIRTISRSGRIASLCAVIFGIHPMHAESVAWISGRKDLLYTFFYLMSCQAYLSYLTAKGGAAKMRYVAAVMLFVFSLLSKSSAVTLPAVLLLIDYYRGRKVSLRLLLEKAPFILPAILIGIWSIKGQHDAGSLADNSALSLYSRLSIACYSFLFYCIKFFAPFRLSALYPYPDSLPTSLPLLYVLSPVLAAAVAGVVWYFRRSKTAVFGVGLFFINVVFILHFVVVGATVTADRFSYLSYLGLIYIVVCYGKKIIAARPPERRKSATVIGSIAIALLVVIFGYSVHRRCSVWKNSITLWTDVIEKSAASAAYNNRAHAWYEAHNFAGALEDFTVVIARHPNFADGYLNRGLTRDALGDHARAIDDYNRAIAIRPNFAEALEKRGILGCMRGDFTAAIADFDRAIALEPDLPGLYVNRGNAFGSRGDYLQAINDFSRALTLIREPSLFPQIFFNRGRAYQALGDYPHAEEDFMKACALHFDAACRTLSGNR